MANSFKLQVPADVHNLAVLIGYLVGFATGPIKAARIKEGWVDIWFVLLPNGEEHQIRRARALLIRGVAEVCNNSPRRVYTRLSLQDLSQKWRYISDEDYLDACLRPPHEYDGESHIGITYDTPAGEAWWSDRPDGTVNETIPYYRMLPGDYQRAVAEAEARIAEWEAEE